MFDVEVWDCRHDHDFPVTAVDNTFSGTLNRVAIVFCFLFLVFPKWPLSGSLDTCLVWNYLKASILHLRNQKYDGIPFFYKQYHMKQPRKFYFFGMNIVTKIWNFCQKKKSEKRPFCSQKSAKISGKTLNLLCFWNPQKYVSPQKMT